MKLLQSSTAFFVLQHGLRPERSSPTCSTELNAALSSSIIDPILQHPSIPKLSIDKLSIDSRPRGKLGAKHKHLFENKKKTTDKMTLLFNQLAIVACETGVVPRKELFETFAAAAYIHAKFPHITRVADLAAGHGLLSWFLLALDYNDHDDNANGSVISNSRRQRTVVCVDRRMPPSAEIIAAAMINQYPELESRWSYIQSDISSVVPHPSCLLTSVHACGTLTDYLIELAIGDAVGGSTGVPLAVVPCCHTVKARKGYRPHFLSGMDVGQVAALVEERKNNSTEHSKREAVANVLDDVRKLTMESAGYEVEEVMLPEIFTARNRLLLGEMKEKFSTNDINTRVGLLHQNSPAMFERQPPSKETIQIPLSDDEDSISKCHAISGKARASTRLLQQIPKHFSPSLVISIWLDSAQLERKSSIDESALLLETLQSFANQSCKNIEKDEIECTVEVLGEVYVQPETGRRSQRYKFAYKKPEGTDISKAIVSRENAKAIDGAIRDTIVNKFGSILR